jgi:Domain of unknown function (DUF3459)
VPALRHLSKTDQEVTLFEDQGVIVARRWSGESEALIAYNFAEEERTVPVPGGDWRKLLASGCAEIAGGELRMGRRSVALLGR